MLRAGDSDEHGACDSSSSLEQLSEEEHEAEEEEEGVVGAGPRILVVAEARFFHSHIAAACFV